MKIIIFFTQCKSKENRKLLREYAAELGRNVLADLRKRQNIDFPNPPVLINEDTGKSFKVQMTGINEIKNHDIFLEGHIETISNLEDIITKSIYICSEENEDNRKPNLKKFHYFAAGIQFNDEDFTVKAVFTENDTGEIFYDQSLSTVEKGKLVEILSEKNKLNNLNPIISQEIIELLEEDDKSTSGNYDKRLITICQVPQLPYLDEKLIPTKETVRLVKEGKLRCVKKGQTYSIETHADVEKNELKASSPQKKAKDSFEPSQEEYNNLSPLITQREVTSSYVHYDKRLINTCQVPQIPYLDEKSLKEELKSVLNEKAKKLDTVEYSRTNYDKLFPFGIVETPVETVKLGENQFRKLESKNRERLLFATYQTLKIPDIVFIEEKITTDSNRKSKSHNYVKSFIFDANKKVIQNIVVSIDEKNISISSHPREINNVVNKNKKSRPTDIRVR